MAEAERDLQKQMQTYQFLMCTSSLDTQNGTDPVNVAEQCYNEYFPADINDYPLLVLCAHNEDQLKATNRDKTSKVNVNSLPAVVVNGVQLSADQIADTSKMLTQTLCESFGTGLRPDVCYELEPKYNKQLNVTVYLGADSNTVNFVQKQISPIVELANEHDASLRLRDLVQWTFVPWANTQYNTSDGTLACPNDDQNQCQALRLLACAIKQGQIQSDQVKELRTSTEIAKLVVCFFKSANFSTEPSEAMNECANDQFGLDAYAVIWQCSMDNDNQLQVFLDMKAQTENNYPAITSCKSHFATH